MSSSVARATGAPVVACPPDEQLLDFLSAHAPDEESALSVHVRTCSACQTRLTTLSRKAGAAQRDGPDTSPRPAAPSQSPQAEGASPSDRTTTLLPLRPRVPRQIGQYALVRLIGRGGMGLVYQARHVRLGRTFAVKLLPGLHLSDPSAVIRLQRETAAAGRVGHPNVVLATDAGEVDGIDYLVMEYVDGVDLSKLVATHGPLPVADACEIARQAALGLAHIAECGLVHRDIKPSNLMLARDGTVKILDLGLARLREGKFDDREATHSGFLLGTADYVSPEQADRPQTADIRSDLYSLGCTLFKLLAGRAPFDDDEHSSFATKLEAHRSAPPPSIAALRADVPQALDELVARLLAKEPASRPQRPEAAADVLAPLAEHADVMALGAKTADQIPVEVVQPMEIDAPAPAPSRSSTHRPISTATPRGQSLPTARSYPVLLTAGVPAVALLALGLGWAAMNGGLVPAGGQKERADTPQIAAAPETTLGPIDLQRPLDEIIWPGYQPSTVKPQYDEDVRMLEVRPDSFRFLQLGDYDGRPGTFAVTIRQNPWRGYAGLFFGYRLESTVREPKIATYQLFMVNADPPLPQLAPGKPLELFVRRSRAWIDLPLQFQEGHSVQEQVNAISNDLRLEVRFANKRCVGVSVNGRELATLCTDELNANYRDADYLGPWGLYADTGLGNRDPTWFGDVVFTPIDGE